VLPNDFPPPTNGCAINDDYPQSSNDGDGISRDGDRVLFDTCQIIEQERPV